MDTSPQSSLYTPLPAVDKPATDLTPGMTIEVELWFWVHCLCCVLQVQEEERRRNESHLMTLVSDSISAMVFFAMFARDTQGRTALFNTLGRLFAGLSDIAKAVLIILVADTLLGYHSEEGERDQG